MISTTPRTSPLAKLSGPEALKRGINQVVTQWTPGIKPTWTIREVRTALRLHRQGDFSLSALLVDSMGEDDAIPGHLEKLVDSVLGEEFCLEPVDKPNRQLSKRIASELEPAMWDMFPEAELDEFVRWYEMLGVGLATLDWDKSATAWRPKLRTLHPQFLWRDEFQGKWLYNAQEGQLEVTPGDGTWLLITDGQRGWMRGKVRAAAIPWIGKQLTIRDQGRYNERHGFPIILARSPAIAEEGDRDQFWEDIKGLATESAVDLPTHVDGQNADAKYDLDLLEATDKSHEAFERTLDRWDRRLTILFLGGNQSTEVSGDTGTNASAKQHATELDDKAQALEKRLSTQVRKQGLWPVVAFNYAGAAFEVTPWPHWDVEQAEDADAEAKHQKGFGEALKAVQDAGYDVENVEQLAERHGLVLVKREAPAPVVPPGVPPGDEPGDEDDSGDEPEEGNEPDPEATAAAVLAQTQAQRNGQEYADRVRRRMVRHGSKALALTVAGMMSAVRGAGSYEEAERAIVAKYGKLAAPKDLASLTEAALTMTQLGGHLSVDEES